MRSAIANSGEILARVKTMGCVLMLDFDGTLTAIEHHHRAPRLSREMKAVVQKISKTYPVAIVSGRSLADIKKRVGIGTIAYAGCHGLEWYVRGKRHDPKLSAETKEAFAFARQQLTYLARKYDAVIEDKKNSYAVHYRTLSPGARRACEQDARTIARAIDETNLVRVILDQCTLDIMPNLSITKGTTALRLFRALRTSTYATPIYIGDSATDEDAFAAFPHGVTIRVGKHRKSAARFFLHEQRDVGRFLSALDALVTKNPAAASKYTRQGRAKSPPSPRIPFRIRNSV